MMKQMKYLTSKVVSFQDPVKTQKNILSKVYNLHNTYNKKKFKELDYVDMFDNIFSNEGSFFITSIFPHGKDFILSVRGINKYVFVVKDFYPYFFATEKSRSHYIEPISDKILITYDHPGFTKQLRKKFKQTFEADILYDIRFLTTIGYIFKKQNFISSNVAIRKWYCDIEVYVRNREKTFDPTCKDNFINVINIFDHIDNVLYTILVGNKQSRYELDFNLTGEHIQNKVIEVLSEKDLLVEFFKLYKSINPDFLIFWNATYDTSFIYYKTLHYIDQIWNDILPIPEVIDKNKKENNIFFEDKDYQTETSIYHILGSTVLDLLLLYKQSMDTKEEYTLDYISQVELGDEVGGKVKYEGTLEDLYDKNLDLFLDYSRKDAYLLYLIDVRQNITNKFIGLSEISLLPMRYFNSNYSIKLADCMYMQYLYDKNMIMTTKRQDIKEKYEGAHVHLPKAGIYRYFCDLDASSMYPSIIISANISIDTFVCYIKDVYNVVNDKLTVDKDFVEQIRQYLIEDIENGISSKEVVIVNIYGMEKKISLKKLKDMLKSRVGSYSLSPAGVIFRTDKIGILPYIMRDMIEYRKKYKKLRELFAT